MIDWVAKLGVNRSKLASFSIAKYGAQTGNDWQWFPDAGNGIRTGGQYVTGNDPNDANVPSNSTFSKAGCSISSTAGVRTRTAACATTFSTTSRASGTPRIAMFIRPARRWTRSKDKMIDYARQDQSDRPDGARGGAGGVGLERLLLQRLRSAVRQLARLGQHARSQQPRRLGLFALVPRPVAAESHMPRATATRRLHASTTIRRAASSATTLPAPCSCGATARRARCGIRTTSTKPGSTIACNSSRGLNPG